MTVPGIKCPECKSSRVWKSGTMPTRHGKVNRYKCTDCGRSFGPGAMKAAKKKAKRANKA
jgi:transposase-like protein